MEILAIDTSCDDTCISIIKVKSGKLKVKSFEILSNVVSSQVKIHQKYGGVYPALAKREHQQNLVPVLIKALNEVKMLKQIRNPEGEQVPYGASKSEIRNPKSETLEKILERDGDLLEKLTEFLKKYQKPRIDLIAVTIGPGLEPCLWTGINFARALAFFWNLPIVPVNHIESHILANWLTPISGKSRIQNLKYRIIFPTVCLVVSGGHTELLLLKNIGKYKLLGETRDDAAGECLDKAARVLGLSYPGGPVIAKLAATVKKQKYNIKLPRPMLNSKDYDFSFSGLKTAVLYLVKKLGRKKLKNIRLKAEITAEIGQAIIDVLISKTIRAAKEFNARTILLGGGVVSNKELRKQFKKAVKKYYPLSAIRYPPSKLCTDNAAMIGVAGYFKRLQKQKNWKKIKAHSNLRIG